MVSSDQSALCDSREDSDRGSEHRKRREQRRISITLSRNCFAGMGSERDETLRFHFVQTLTAHAIGHGGGYAYITWDGTKPVEFLQLRPDRTYPVLENGRLMFVTAIGGDFGAARTEVWKLLAENVLHIHGLGYDGLTGYSLLSLASRSLGAARSQKKNLELATSKTRLPLQC